VQQVSAIRRNCGLPQHCRVGNLNGREIAERGWIAVLQECVIPYPVRKNQYGCNQRNSSQPMVLGNRNGTAIQGRVQSRADGVGPGEADVSCCSEIPLAADLRTLYRALRV